MAWSGLIIGLIFGVILQRGRVCFNSAYRDLVFFKDNYLMKLYTFAVGLEAILFVLFAQFGLITLNPKPINLVGNTLGAFTFGLGMVLAGGCASGVTYRTGEGLTTAWFAALIYGLTATSVKGGALKFISNWLGQFNKTVENHVSSIYKPQSGLTLPDVFHINPLVMAIIFAAILWVYAFGTKTTNRETKLSWKVAAVLLAILAPFAWWTSQKAGRMYGLGITGGWINLIKSFTTGEALSWEGFEIIGIIIGAAISAVQAKEFKLRMPKQPKTYVQVMIGGVLMGLGAAMADACNIGHALTGVGLMAVSSIIATVFFMLGNWTMAWFLFGRK
ncbi:hypothetical protein SAMN04488510_11129 [Fervidobacterium changbaicum]|uniref:YeeE/YedE family protein n=2 Tax=Fervidobacterium TaxID=2422 RepID=A0AAI8CKE0_FERIS|nr:MULTISPECIES: YeeE/YedE family protein [Fervidobacterium]AMW32534.1 YeeE/YedE family protein [Fervidobacterium islandicum]QAV32620.1 YeeE/YedE family protein [Fervidobacterium changbaicum]SDH34992.1 hypothetical protein SAMN04488510_11129 [Fervidobacterium changbaicum]